MYKESEKEKQTGLWGGNEWALGKRSQKFYDDKSGWHHQFRREVVNRIDESVFKPLFCEDNGTPNYPIRILVGMIILKEGMGLSDSQLFEGVRFNLLIRNALGLFEIEEEPPAESTYYLFRKKIAEYAEAEGGEDLLEKAFRSITKGQCLEYGVAGRRIRMDSKLMGSNIAYYTRYEIIHQTIRKYAKENPDAGKNLAAKQAALLAEVKEEEGHSVNFRSTREEIQSRLSSIGLLMYRLINEEGAEKRSGYELMKRVFEEQYEVSAGPGGGKKKTAVKARKVVKKGDKDKDDGSGTKGTKKVQNPNDTDCEYREKGEQRVKGYSHNITETCDEGGLNLIVDVQTAGATAGDGGFFKEAVEGAKEVVGGKVEEAYTDGAYHSPSNQEYCGKEKIEWILRGISGKPSKYDVSFDDAGEITVINTETGEKLKAVRAKTRDPDAPERWRVKDGSHAPIYFERKDAETCALRKRLAEIPKEKLNVRNNVEATIFQFGYHYRRNKSRYRGRIKHHMWAVARCLWINCRRICKYNGDMDAKSPDSGSILMFLSLCLRYFFLRRNQRMIFAV
jgi:hypothetical protein